MDEDVWQSFYKAGQATYGGTAPGARPCVPCREMLNAGGREMQKAGIPGWMEAFRVSGLFSGLHVRM